MILATEAVVVVWVETSWFILVETGIQQQVSWHKNNTVLSKLTFTIL